MARPTYEDLDRVAGILETHVELLWSHQSRIERLEAQVLNQQKKIDSLHTRVEESGSKGEQ